jgi:hypothetical protein
MARVVRSARKAQALDVHMVVQQTPFFTPEGGDELSIVWRESVMCGQPSNPAQLRFAGSHVPITGRESSFITRADEETKTGTTREMGTDTFPCLWFVPSMSNFRGCTFIRKMASPAFRLMANHVSPRGTPALRGARHAYPASSSLGA